MVQFTGGNRQLHTWVIVTIRLISDAVISIGGVWLFLFVRGS